MSRRAARRVTGALPETAVVEDMTVEGCGVATVGGKRVFIGGAIRGETVTFRRTRSLRHYDEASIVAVTEASPERVAPACRYFGVCGGCSLQHLAPEAQLRLKEQALMDSLERIGNVRPVRVLPPASGSPWGYRRRARRTRRVPALSHRHSVRRGERGADNPTAIRSPAAIRGPA
jgi:23S rRNA (uracil1939-C5)-methyltransferase